MHLFPRGQNILERKPVGGAHFNWLHVLEGPHRGRGPQEPPSISTLPRGTLGPVLSIWPAAPVRSPSQQDQRCGGRVLGGGRAEALNRIVHASVKSGGGDSGAGTRGRRPWPPGSRLLQQQKGTRFLLQASVPGTAPAPPGERGPLSSGAEPWLETQAPAAWHTCAAAACTSAQQAPGVLGVRSGRWGSLGTPHRTHHVSDSQQPLHMWPGSKPRALR